MRARARARRQPDHWPGFVDALAGILLVMVFLLSVFVLAQFFLGRALTGRDAALRQLETQIAQLGELLALERRAAGELRLTVSGLSETLQDANAERERMAGEATATREEIARLTAALDAARARATGLETQLTATRDAGIEALTDVERLSREIAALRQQLSALAAALDASEARAEADQMTIEDLGTRLNQALADKVEELARYRSEFFGRLREVLGERPDVRVVGDRFVFQSEVLFAAGSAEIGAGGREQLATFARTLVEIAAEIPPELPWVLRVDGHTDATPIATAQYPSNWALSTARAVTVVRFLIDQGLAPERLAAAGFGEFQPIEPDTGPEARMRNRRIELKLTER